MLEFRVLDFNDFDNTGAFTVSGSIDEPAQAILTPALLPGLVGMGVAAWRKRKSADAQAKAVTSTASL